jgi:hypothetical protein
VASQVRVSETANPSVVQLQMTEATRRAMSGVEKSIGAPFGVPEWVTAACSASFGKLLIADTTAGAFNVSLPPATQSDVGNAVMVKIWGALTIRVYASGSDVIDDSDSYAMATAWQSCAFVVAATGKWISVARI